MKILFSPVGDTDPVRGYHDGAVMHILRHYPGVEKVILFLTKEMQEKQKETGCYTRGIARVLQDGEVSLIESGITDPQHYESLIALQKAFQESYEAYPDAEWLLNVSSGTPQMKTVMALIAIDYARTTAVQVDSPKYKNVEERRQAYQAPCTTADELVEMLDANLDEEEDAVDRCTEPPLRLLRRYGIALQIASLVRNYEYRGAWELLKQNRDMFGEDTEKLLRHAVFREELNWKEANRVVSKWKGQPLISPADDFTEYFRGMLLKQKKGQLADFIIRLSPVLLEFGRKYLEELAPKFELSACGNTRGDGPLYIKRDAMNRYYPKLLAHIECEIGNTLRDGPLYFNLVAYICDWLKTNTLAGSKTHEEVTDLFNRLRLIEEGVRNPVAHTITNVTEDTLKGLADRNGKKVGMSSDEIVKKLLRLAQLVRKNRVELQYDKLNDRIIDSMKES